MADPARTQRRLNTLPQTGTRLPFSTRLLLSGRASLLAIALLVAVAGGAIFLLNSHTPLSAAFLPVNFAKGVPTAATANAANAANRAAAGQLDPEAVLQKTLAEIRHQRMDNALTEIDKVIGAYPNFRLAHLIKGDLLMARAHPIKSIGNASEAPQEQLDDLREEARARLARQLSERPKNQVPRYLVQMPPEQRYALVVDTAKSTLYVYENKDGEARYVADYYASIGKNGMDKFREGDNKTPLGVYHVTGSISREQLNQRYGKLAGEYGVGALPINFPNEWDKRGGRNGSGIWLHGVPFDTYSRPPRASNGCVALTNEDFMAVSATAQVGVTPVIIANSIEWTSPEGARAVREELSQAVESWRRDWESLNTPNYLKHYSPTKFSTGSQNYQAWVEHKQRVNAGKTWIKVKVDNVSMFFYPGATDLAVVTFDQDYNSSNLVGQSKKRQYWMKEPGGWKIVYEGMS